MKTTQPQNNQNPKASLPNSTRSGAKKIVAHTRKGDKLRRLIYLNRAVSKRGSKGSFCNQIHLRKLLGKFFPFQSNYPTICLLPCMWICTTNSFQRLLCGYGSARQGITQTSLVPFVSIAPAISPSLAFPTINRKLPLRQRGFFWVR